MPIDSVHPQVANMQSEWTKIRDVLAGDKMVKSPERRYTYLPRLPGQRIVPNPGYGNAAYIGIPSIASTGAWIDEYLLYLNRAVLLSGFAERVQHGLVGMVMRKKPEFEVPPAIADEMENITLDGTTAAGFTKMLLAEDLSVSWGGVLVDWSERHGRPYQRCYCAEDVQNWRIDYLDGQPIPTRVMLAEHMMMPDPEDPWQEKCVEQRRVLELVPEADLMATAPTEFPFGMLVHRMFQKQMQTNGQEMWVEMDRIVPMRRERPLGFIPFQPFNALEAAWKCSRPALLNLIDMILAHYRNSADYENAIHCAGVPTLAVWGIGLRNAGDNIAVGGGQAGQHVEIGPGRIITGENPGGHAEYVQTGGQGAAEIKQAMEDKKAEMATMVARLLLSEQRRVAETAEAQRIAFAGDDASLVSVVDAIEQTLTNTCTWQAWWAGTYETVEDAGKDVSVTLNRDFIEAPITADELNRLGLEVDANRLSLRDYFYNAQRGGRVRPDIDFDEYQIELRQQKMAQGAQGANGNGMDVAAEDAAMVD